ncbi:MAG: hypothetical protein PHG83_04190 [Patescibacteria group bacterium]|nr:hypothetical protein [Patescibacteria group bacterium]
MSKKEKPIEKLWCICLGEGCRPQHIGKVEKEDSGHVYVKYSEKQQGIGWNPRSILRYETGGEAIIKFAKFTNTRLERVKRSVLSHFPSEKEHIF